MSARLERVIAYAILTALSVGTLLPFVSVLFLALGPSGPNVTGLTPPESVSLDNFIRSWDEGGFAQLMLNSAIVVAGVVPTVVIFAVLAGYAFGTMDFPFRKPLFFLLLAGLVVPYEAAVIPLYFGLRDVGLTDTHLGLMLPLIGLLMAFSTYWMRAYFMTAPDGLIEAARTDGANSWTILWRILLPGARPAIMTLIVLTFMWTWNEFFLSFILIQDPDVRTAPAGLGAFIGERNTDFSGLAAGALIITIPVLVLYVILQRSFVRGLLSGSIKG
jgi:raffinose/stachyose/melibiose transport system permease protein